MELVQVLRQLWGRRMLVLVVALVAAMAAAATAYRPEGMPPKLQKRSLGIGAASTQVLVDTPRSSQTNIDKDPTPLSTRALVFAQAMSSLQGRAAIAKETGIPAIKIAAKGPFSSESNRSTFQAQPSEPRANEILGEGEGYRLLFDAQQELPIVSIYAQAPTALAAEKLANGASRAMRKYVTTLGVKDSKSDSQVVLRDLGPAEGGTVNQGVSTAVMALVFIGILTLGCLLIVFGSGLAREWRRLGEQEHHAIALDPTSVENPPEHSRLRRAAGAIVPARRAQGELTAGELTLAPANGNGNAHASGEREDESASHAVS
jgi:hypothetical protein